MTKLIVVFFLILRKCVKIPIYATLSSHNSWSFPNVWFHHPFPHEVQLAKSHLVVPFSSPLTVPSTPCHTRVEQTIECYSFCELRSKRQRRLGQYSLFVRGVTQFHSPVQTDQNWWDGKDEFDGVLVHSLKGLYRDFICDTKTIFKHFELSTEQSHELNIYMHHWSGRFDWRDDQFFQLLLFYEEIIEILTSLMNLTEYRPY